MVDLALRIEIKDLRSCIRDLRKIIKLLEKEKAIEKKGDDTMPSIEHMRSAISDAYEGEGWKYRCRHMHANQVIAIYGSLMRRGAFDDPDWRKKSSSSKSSPDLKSSEGSNGCTDGPKFIPYTGVQLSMFDL